MDIILRIIIYKNSDEKKLGGIKMNEEKTEKKSRKKSSSKKESSEPSKSSKKEIHYHYHGAQSPHGGRGYHSGWQQRVEEKPGEIHYHYYYEPPRHRVRRSSKPTIAGGLLIANGFMQIIAVMFLIAVGMFFGGLGEGILFMDEDITGDISGNVAFENGTPVENVSISIIGHDLNTITDQNGNYVLLDVPIGNQKIKVEKEGYLTIIHRAFINSNNLDGKNEDPEINFNEENSDNEFDFELTPGTGESTTGSYMPTEWIEGFLYFCAVVLIIISIFQFVGGYYAIKRKKFGLVLVSAILGIFGILAIIAIFILVLSRREFNSHSNLVENP
jgi:hypothetical protein